MADHDETAGPDAEAYERLLHDAAAGHTLEAELLNASSTLREVADRMRADAAEGLAILVDVDASDEVSVRRAQYQARRYRDFLEYLAEIASDSDQATEQLLEGEPDYDLSPQAFPRQPTEPEINDA